MGRKSTIDYWPEDLREKLQGFLRDRSITQAEAKHRINALIDEMGLDVGKISDSGVNRYASKMEKVGAKLRQSREISEMWIAKLGNQPQGKMGALQNEMLRGFVFELMLKLQESEISADDIPELVKILNKLALTQQRLEQSSTINQKREEQIRKQALEEAAQNVEDAAIARGMNKEEAGYWRQKVLQGR